MAEWEDYNIDDFFNYIKFQQDSIDRILDEKAKLYYKWLSRDPVPVGATERAALRDLQK